MWPTFSPDFVDKLWLSIVDKLALGAVVLLLGYLINRRLEGIKSREGVRKTMLERRITAILEQWDAVRHLHFDTVDAWMDRVRQEESALAGELDGSPPDGPGDPQILMHRAYSLTRAVRAHRGPLGKTIANAMYGAIGNDLRVAGTLASGEPVPTYQPPDNLDFDWLERLLDAPDLEELPLITREAKLVADRAEFRKRAAKRRGTEQANR
jgi:hypothetical protein